MSHGDPGTTLRDRLWKWGRAGADFGLPVGLAGAGAAAFNAERLGLTNFVDWFVFATFLAAIPLCAGVGLLAAYLTFRN